MKADASEYWLKKTHVETGYSFISPFSDKNCPGWSAAALQDLNELAEKRIKELSFHLEPKGWKYEIKTFKEKTE